MFKKCVENGVILLTESVREYGGGFFNQGL
jgi:hypothetical protein